MRSTVRLFILIFVALLSAKAEGASINDIEIAATAPGYMASFVTIVLYLCIPILFGVLILWSIWHAKDNRLGPAAITFGGMLVVVLGLLVFFGQGPGASAYAGYDAARDGVAPTGYEWHTYGESEGLWTNFPSQAHGYEMQKGWALAGAVYWFKLIDIGFSFYIIPLLGLAGCVWAVYMAYAIKSPRPLLVHVAAMILVVPLYVLPTVVFTAPVTDNPMYRLVVGSVTPSDGADTPGGAPPEDAPRVSPFVAISFGVLTDLAEKVGERISFGSREPYSVIVQASLDARLTSGDFDMYMRYASFCFTAVKSVTELRQSKPINAAYGEYYDTLMGSEGSATPTGVLGNFNNAPVPFRHALSPYSDALFKDLWVPRWVFMDWPDILAAGDNYPWYNGTYSITEIPQSYSFHPNPHIGAGNVERVTWPKLSTTKGVERMRASDTAGVSPVAVEPSDVFGSFRMGVKRYIPFCSVRGFRGTADTYSAMSTSDLLPTLFNSELPDADDRQLFRPLGYDDLVRSTIARRYLGEGAVDFCNGVSPDILNEHLWGCLIAGRYRRDATEQDKSMKAIQDLFDDRVRPMLEDEIAVHVGRAEANGGEPAERSATVTYFSSGSFEVGGRSFDFQTFRNFNDLFFASTGVQSQIGLFGDFKSTVSSSTNTSNWFYDLMVSIGGYVKPGVAGVIAWIAIGITKIAMMMYPHVIGVMTFILLLKSVPYLVRGVLFGQWLYPVFHLLPGIALVCAMPLFVQIGLSFTEIGNGMALPAIFVRSQAGSSFGESVMQIIGSFFIFGAFSLSATFLTLGFGSIAGVLGSVNASAFKLTGAATAGILAVTGMAAGALGGGLASALVNKLSGMQREALDGPPRPPGGGPGTAPGPSSPTAPALPGPNGGVGRADGTSGTVRNEVGKAPVEMGSRHQAADMQQQMGASGSSRTHQLGHAAAGTLALAGSAIEHGTRHAADAASAIVSGIHTGAEGAALAQGIGIGHSLMASVGSSGASLASIGAGILDASGRSYQDIRDPNGEIRGSAPFDEKASGEFARTAETADTFAQVARESGDAAGHSGARKTSGQLYRDAARLTANPMEAGQFGIKAAEAYIDVGDFKTARTTIGEAQRRLSRAHEMATSDMERGDISTQQAQLAVLDNKVHKELWVPNPHTFNSSGDDDLSQAIEYHHKDADSRYARHQASLMTQLQQNGESSTWSDYGAAALARMRAAHIADGSQQQLSKNLVIAQTRDLQKAVEGGDKGAAVVLGFVYGGAGLKDEARRIFDHHQISISDAEIAAMQDNVRIGRFAALNMRSVMENNGVPRRGSNGTTNP